MTLVCEQTVEHESPGTLDTQQEPLFTYFNLTRSKVDLTLLPIAEIQASGNQ